jgi:hypothetical protein
MPYTYSHGFLGMRCTLSLQLPIPKQRTLPPLQAILLAEGTLNLTVQITSASRSITLSTTAANDSTTPYKSIKRRGILNKERKL